MEEEDRRILISLYSSTMGEGVWEGNAYILSLFGHLPSLYLSLLSLLSLSLTLSVRNGPDGGDTQHSQHGQTHEEGLVAPLKSAGLKQKEKKDMQEGRTGGQVGYDDI